jgi:hypothetical protein
MVETQNVASHRLLISYPWISKEERDFAYLVNQLKAANIEATYDSYQILPGRHLWQRIEQRLSSIGFDGWLYILTHQCFTGGMFANTLSTAIDQTTQRLCPEMPVAGLMYGVAAQNVPPALRGRPCISLGDPAWRQQLSEILERRTRQSKGTAAQVETRFVWRIHPNYGNNPSMTAVEVRARHESVEYWRFDSKRPRDMEGMETGKSPGSAPPILSPIPKAPTLYFPGPFRISSASGRPGILSGLRRKWRFSGQTFPDKATVKAVPCRTLPSPFFSKVSEFPAD